MPPRPVENLPSIRETKDELMIGMMLTAVVVFMIATFPATWLLMLFLGNVMHVGPSYWGTLPLGIIVSLLLAGTSAGRSRS
jgi:hypothetical protein